MNDDSFDEHKILDEPISSDMIKTRLHQHIHEVGEVTVANLIMVVKNDDGEMHAQSYGENVSPMDLLKMVQIMLEDYKKMTKKEREEDDK